MFAIQAYKAKHCESLIELYKDKHAYGGHFDADRDSADRLLATAEQSNLYVLLQDDKVVGSFMILENPHSFWLLRFVINPALRNQKELAKLLFEKAQAIAAERGHQSVLVFTDTDDPTLNQRYIDLGCHQASNYRCYWKETA